MGFLFNLKIIHLFQLACWIVTISLTLYEICIFWSNKDLSNVEFLKYYDNPKDVYPVLTLCLKSPFAGEKLKKNGEKFNVTNYLDFIEGNIFNHDFVGIDYQGILKNLSDYIEEDFIRFRNGTTLSVHPEYYDDPMWGQSIEKANKLNIPSSSAFFYFGYFYNCYELTIPQDGNIEEYFVRGSNNLFPYGVRNTVYDFLTFFHYPNQLLESLRTMHHQWPHVRHENDSYVIRFKITGVEVLNRRQKPNRPCNENSDHHDSTIIDKYLTNIGCKPPYLKSLKHFPNCTSQEQLRKRFYLRTDHYGILPPCKTMDKIYYSIHEDTLDTNKLSWARNGSFWIGIFLHDDHFKDIRQTR